MTSSSETLPSDFVYIHEIIPDIQVSLRYATEENFVGKIVDGYYSNVSIMTKAAALSLKYAQELAKENGYELVIYDSYRPQKSVNHFVKWSEDVNDPQTKKEHYYPRVDKANSFNLGYIARKSGHTRGSTIDLTIIPIGKRVQHPVTPIKRILNDKSTILFLDDGTVDMGSSFDLFDEASFVNSTLVNENHQQMRKIFKNIMEQAGFVGYRKEWWHFTLKNEPFPNTYFDFDVKSTYQSS
ncbi:hypothetical protein I4U23_023648 [Adineta vaga]|nr:hypothetical protein I4U23_023648 [Adineta vaga]